MSTLQIGCPMWAHRPWVGRFLPAATPVGGELAAYSRYLNAVEGNTTFYASPSQQIVARWKVQADPTFRFVFKVPRTITHERRLRDVDDLIGAFVGLLEPLVDQVESLTLQLPASFAPRDLPALEAVLAAAPTGWRWSVELRHPDFFSAGARLAADRMLARRAAERVVLDSRTLFTQPPLTEAGRLEWETKPRLPVLVDSSGERPIVRFIGSDDPVRTAAGLAEWEPVVSSWLTEGRTPTVFVHTPDNHESPGFARSFHTAIGRLQPELVPLPEPSPILDVQQDPLF